MKCLLWQSIRDTSHDQCASPKTGQNIIVYADRSLQLLQVCERDHPEVLEVYMAKGIVLKHAGDLEGAAAACYTAQSLDTADRQAKNSNSLIN